MLTVGPHGCPQLTNNGMLVYLDTNIVQYCADAEDFIFGNSDISKVADPRLIREIVALCRLVELEQLGDWHFVASLHLMAELNAGKPRPHQRQIYKVLEEAWKDSVYSEDPRPSEEDIRDVEQSLSVLKLRHAPDRRHLAEALALNASWFLTNDKEVVNKVNRAKQKEVMRNMRVCRASECLSGISTGLFLK